MDHLTEQDAGLLEQAASMLEGLANDERNRGNCSGSEGAACSAHAIRRLAPALLRAGAAPAAVAPRGEYPHEQMDAMALARYKVVPSHASMLWSHAVVAGDGVQQLYVGREAECQNMARKFAGAFLDGAFAFHSMAAAPTTQAAPALEAPAASHRGAVNDLAQLLFDAWAKAEPEHGVTKHPMSYWASFCDMARTVLAAAPQAQASAPDWWRGRADEIEVQVAATGNSEAMRCYTDMRTLLQAAAAPQAPAAPADAQAFAEWWDRERVTARNRLPGDDWMDLSNDDREQYEAAFNAGMRAAKAAPAAPAVDAETIEDAARFRAIANAGLTDDEAFDRALEKYPELGGDATIDDVRAMFDAARAAVAAQAKEGGA